MSSLLDVAYVECVILNLYESYEELDKLFSIYNSSFPKSDIIHISFYMDEYYAKTRSTILPVNTFIVSPYLKLIDYSQIYLKLTNDENDYLDWKIYSIYSFVEWYDNILNGYDYMNVENKSISLQYFNHKNIYDINDLNLFYENIVTNHYIGKVNLNGNVIEVVDLNSKSAECVMDYWIYENQYTCKNGNIEYKEDVIKIGYMSVLNGSSINYQSVLRGIIETIDQINSYVYIFIYLFLINFNRMV